MVIALGFIALGFWEVGVLLGFFALLLFIPPRLAGADKGSPRYLKKVRWAFRLVGVGFLLLAVAQAVGLVGYAMWIAIPLGVAAGVAFIFMAERVIPALLRGDA